MAADEKQRDAERERSDSQSDSPTTVKWIDMGMEALEPDRG